MSNRRRPRRPELHELRFIRGTITEALGRLADYRCPDCDSDVVPVAVYGDRLAQFEVQHSDGCPWLAAHIAGVGT